MSPMKPKRPCASPMCCELIDIGTSYCDKHTKEKESKYKKDLPDYRKWYSTKRWIKARLSYLRVHPLCVHCKQNNRVTSATVVDHKTPHKGNLKLFWDSNNWQGLCGSCHGRKTATDDGGFGNK